jgi:Transposase IS116/IS110/IS902 family
MTHPGVGPLTALAFVLIIGAPERFGSGKPVASYLGLVPSEESSGDRRRLGHITKQGNSLLRFLLVEAAQVTVRSDPEWRSRKGLDTADIVREASRVENRRSNCSLPVAIDKAFASSPQSGLAWFCFLFPLIEPDWQISRIRLSEKTHAFAHGWFAVRCGNWTKPYTECRDASGNRLYAGRGSLCLSHNHRRSLRRACKSTAL